MQEIKFRGKRIDNQEWVYGWYYSVTKGEWFDPIQNGHFIMTFKKLSNGEIVLTGCYEVDPETVGRFTGFQDKNDIEIFDGDIVKTVALSNDHHQRGATAVSPVAYWCGNVCLSKTHVPLYPFCINHIIEVIGNIYDNHQLIQ